MSFNEINILSTFAKRQKHRITNVAAKLQYAYYSVILTALLLSACKKMVEIDQPVSSITTEGAFSTDATASSAVAGIYSNLINTGTSFKFGNGAISVFAGMSADELSRVGISGDLLQFRQNNLTPQNTQLPVTLWGAAYSAIYQTNSCIEGLQNSNMITAALKNQLIGECKFLRAFLYLNLTNLWGEIPIPLSSEWMKTYLEERVSKSAVYQQIVADLKDAQELLPGDYSVSNNERARANKYAATALLARVYLYQKDWTNAEIQATEVISKQAIYDTVALANVFLKNSKEAILQFQPSNARNPFAVVERFVITAAPIYFLTTELLNSFEVGDQRRNSWVNSTLVSGTTYHQPAKYKVRQGTSGGNVTEYYMVLRLGEQYLIRAEARAQLDKIAEAKSDLDVIRKRARLANSTASDKPSLLMAIEQERKVELFVEWGHRWFDLIRTNRADAILGPIKGTNWQSTDIYYPIPFSEIQRNPNLSQNEGYN